MPCRRAAAACPGWNRPVPARNRRPRRAGSLRRLRLVQRDLRLGQAEQRGVAVDRVVVRGGDADRFLERGLRLARHAGLVLQEAELDQVDRQPLEVLLRLQSRPRLLEIVHRLRVIAHAPVGDGHALQQEFDLVADARVAERSARALEIQHRLRLFPISERRSPRISSASPSSCGSSSLSRTASARSMSGRPWRLPSRNDR